MTTTHSSANLDTVMPPHSVDILAEFTAFLDAHSGAVTLTAEDGDTKEIPKEVVDVIYRAASALEHGSAVAVAPIEARLTTTQAAELLGVSRPTLIKLLDEGKIPYEQINVHRSLRLADVLEFGERRSITRRAFLDELTRESVADGTYFITAAEADEAFANLRSG